VIFADETGIIIKIVKILMICI